MLLNKLYIKLNTNFSLSQVSSTEAIEHYKKSLEKKTKVGSRSKSTKKEEVAKTATHQVSQARKSTEKDKISAERKKRSSSTGKAASNETKRNEKTDRHAKKETNEEKETSKNVETIDIPPAEVKDFGFFFIFFYFTY